MFFVRMFKPILLISLFIIVIIGCDTNVKPTFFSNLLRDPGDIDDLSSCLSGIPVVDENGIITISADVQCLDDLSNRDDSDPNLSVAFSKILDDPERYMDRLLTFEATLKDYHHGWYRLYTNRKDRSFLIHSQGVEIELVDDENNVYPIPPNERYVFKCTIYEIKILPTGHWQIEARFAVTESKKLVHPPVPVSTE